MIFFRQKRKNDACAFERRRWSNKDCTKRIESEGLLNELRLNPRKRFVMKSYFLCLVACDTFYKVGKGKRAFPLAWISSDYLPSKQFCTADQVTFGAVVCYVTLKNTPFKKNCEDNKSLFQGNNESLRESLLPLKLSRNDSIGNASRRSRRTRAETLTTQASLNVILG